MTHWLTAAILLTATHVTTPPTVSIFDIIPDTVIVAVVTAAASLAIGWLGHRASSKKASSDATRDLLDGYRRDLGEIRDRVTATETEQQELRRQRDEAVRRADEADDTLRDRDELLADFASWTSALHAWGEAGAPPPPPATTWRIQEWQHEQQAHTGQLRRQQRPTD